MKELNPNAITAYDIFGVILTVGAGLLFLVVLFIILSPLYKNKTN